MAADKLDSREQPRGGESVEPRARTPWIRPEVTELPPLTELTLQTGDPIGGGGGTGGGTGSSVF